MGKVDFRKMKKELIEIYEKFIQNPVSMINKAIEYDGKYGGLQVYNDYLKSQPVPKEIEIGLGGLSAIYQYGMWGWEHEAFSDEKIMETARTILKQLKESKT